jgi:hypothetical protein
LQIASFPFVPFFRPLGCRSEWDDYRHRTRSSGAAVVGAKLVATNLNTGLSRESTRANDGGYTFPLLPVGFYSITVQASELAKLYQKLGQTGMAREQFEGVKSLAAAGSFSEKMDK